MTAGTMRRATTATSGPAVAAKLIVLVRRSISSSLSWPSRWPVSASDRLGSDVVEA